MEVFLQIRRKKTTIFTDAKDTATVMELKKMIEAILKVPTDQMQLYKDEAVMEDGKQLFDYGLTSATAKASTPAIVGLALRETATGDYEPLELTSYSDPPELPEVLRSREANDL